MNVLDKYMYVLSCLRNSVYPHESVTGAKVQDCSTSRNYGIECVVADTLTSAITSALYGKRN